MKKITTILCVISMVLPISLFAGLTDEYQVEIDDDLQTAWGVVSDAKASKNKVEAIGCGVKMWKEGAFGRAHIDWGFCQATDSAGRNVMCATTDVSMIEAIYAVGTNSYIEFSWEVNPNVIFDLGIIEYEESEPIGECAQIAISTQSQYIRK